MLFLDIEPWSTGAYTFLYVETMAISVMEWIQHTWNWSMLKLGKPLCWRCWINQPDRKWKVPALIWLMSARTCEIVTISSSGLFSSLKNHPGTALLWYCLALTSTSMWVKPYPVFLQKYNVRQGTTTSFNYWFYNYYGMAVQIPLIFL